MALINLGSPVDIEDVVVDFTPWLEQGNDAITSANVSETTDVMDISNTATDGLHVTFDITGGVSGSVYEVEIFVLTQNGQAKTVRVATEVR